MNEEIHADYIKKNETLFQIGDAARLLNVTRKIILNYEEKGLLTPAVKHKKSGYRYYSADNLVHIRLIRVLQDSGLSLDEVKEYLNDSAKLHLTIDRLERQRKELDSNIARLRLYAQSSKDSSIYWSILAKQTMYCQRIRSTSVAQRTECLRDIYLEAVRLYGYNFNAHMFMEFSLEDESDCLLCIPVAGSSTGENIRIFPETKALCTCYRGPYEDLPGVRSNLLDYIHRNDFKTYGVSRNIYMEGPPNRGDDKANYVTQVAVPVDGTFDGLPYTVQRNQIIT